MFQVSWWVLGQFKVNSYASVSIFHILFSLDVKQGVVEAVYFIFWKCFVLLRNEHLADLVGVVSCFSVGVDGECNVGVLSVLMRVAVGGASEQVVVFHNEGDFLLAAPLSLCSE